MRTYAIAEILLNMPALEDRYPMQSLRKLRNFSMSSSVHKPSSKSRNLKCLKIINKGVKGTRHTPYHDKRPRLAHRHMQQASTLAPNAINKAGGSTALLSQ